MDDVELGRLLGRQARISEPSVESLRAIVRRDRRTRGRNLAVAVVVALAVGAIAGGLYREHEPVPSIALPTEDVQLASFESEQLAALGVARPEPDEAVRRRPGPSPQQSLDRLFLRTTGDGITIRAYRHHAVGKAPCPEGQECAESPPAQCIPSELLVAELSNEGAIGPRHPLPVFSKPGGGSVGVLHAGIFGGRERSPAQWVAVLAGPEVAAVRVTFADGSLDEMAPVDGYAVAARGIELAELSASVDSSPKRPRLGGTVEGLDASGTVLTVDEFAPGDTFRRHDGCPGAGRGGQAPPPPNPGQRPDPGAGSGTEQRPGPEQGTGAGGPSRPEQRPDGQQRLEPVALDEQRGRRPPVESASLSDRPQP